jgi:hypothetical protein
MYGEKLFSYLKAKEFFDAFFKAGFEVRKVYAKISSNAMALLDSNKSLNEELNAKGYPLFDRYCLGFYVWMKKTE